MNCWRVQNLIAPFLDGELREAEAESLAGHLESCGCCRTVVEKVAALPDFPTVQLEPEVEAKLWAEFDACLERRIAESGEEAPEPLVSYRFGGDTAARVRRVIHGDVRLPRSMAAAAAALVVMLVGWNYQTYERLDRLEASLDQRDAIITALQQQVVDRRDAQAFAAGGVAPGPLPVLMPATAPQSTLVGSTRLPPRYQLAAASGPTLIR